MLWHRLGYVKIRALGLPLDALFRVANAGLLSIRDSRTGLLVARRKFRGPPAVENN